VELNPPAVSQVVTEEYDGTTWTASPGGLNTARRGLAGCGIQTAALAFGGYIYTNYSGSTEEYDGSSWATNPTGLNTARTALAGAGTQTAGLALVVSTTCYRCNRRI
jgi:hypothetical protein